MRKSSNKIATFPACHVDYWIISIEKNPSFEPASLVLLAGIRYIILIFSTVTVAQSVFPQSLDHLGNLSLETNGDLGYLHFRKPPPSRAPCWPCYWPYWPYWPYWRCACWPCSWPSQDPRLKKGGKGGEIHVESKTMWMEVYWWEKRRYIQQGWGKLEGSKSKNGVCSETNASDPIIGYPRAPHLTTNNEPCPIYQFCDLERIKKTYWYLIQKKRALSPYHWITTVCGILCTEGKKKPIGCSEPPQDIQFQGRSSVSARTL